MSDIISRILRPIWRLVDMGDGTHAPRMIAQPPSDLLTGTTNQRVRVDPGQTSFYEKREFRTFREWPTPTTATVVVKVVVPVNVILEEFMFQHEEGSFKIETVIGGTEGGAFSEVLPIRSVNTMTEGPATYTPQVVMTMGGTLTGGTVIEVSRAKVASNTNFSSTVGNDGGSVRAVGPLTYYWRITYTGFVGVLKARWEERP